MDVYQHFGLTGPPFSVAPDPRFAYQTLAHENAIAHIAYAVQEHRGLFLLQGEIGTGKTTLGRLLMDHWQSDPDQYRAAYLVSPAVRTQSTFLSAVVEAFDLPPARYLDVLHKTLLDFLLTSREKGKTVVLMLDEAQVLSLPHLDLLHILANHQTIEDQLLQIVLLAQTNITNKLDQRPALRSRIAGGAYLGPISFEDAVGMLRHRMKVVGGDFDAAFDRAVHKPVYNATRGIPRELCLLADAALVTAYAAGKKKIDQATIETVLGNMRFKDWQTK